MLKTGKTGSHRVHALTAGILTAMAATSGFAAEENSSEIEEIVVLGSSRTFSAANTTESMADQQNPIISVLSVIDNLPGVNVTEGDTFGFDD